MARVSPTKSDRDSFKEDVAADEPLGLLAHHDELDLINLSSKPLRPDTEAIGGVNSSAPLVQPTVIKIGDFSDPQSSPPSNKDYRSVVSLSDNATGGGAGTSVAGSAHSIGGGRRMLPPMPAHHYSRRLQPDGAEAASQFCTLPRRPKQNSDDSNAAFTTNSRFRQQLESPPEAAERLANEYDGA